MVAHLGVHGGRLRAVGRFLPDRLAEQPPISVPTISLCGADDGVGPPDEEDGHQFSGPFERRILAGVGHNIPQEAPRATAQALLELLGKG